jgi:mono/diheme cytochrome c family protein
MTGAMCLLAILAILLSSVGSRESDAGPILSRLGVGQGRQPSCCDTEGPSTADIGGTWYWLRSPEEEKRVTAGLFNKYCIRCHGVDGRGIWDIPGVPDFTSSRWQASRSDAQRARIILEGRGAVMPPFRGALSLEEAWAIGRYIHTLEPGTETPRPDLSAPKKTEPPK